ncbi:PTS acetylglucosamine transporter subunit IIB [Candidatus Hepatincola sp. Av]
MQSVGKFFVKLGRSLMLPIAVLPVAGILLRLGQPDVLNIPFIAAAGSTVFDNLPMIFAMGVAIGFSGDNHGAAALAAFVGHAIFLGALKVLLPSANMGVLSGILIGIVAGLLYNRYKTIELPTYLAFFGGRRFVPIVTGAAALVLAFVASLIWPPIAYAINLLGDWIIGSGNIGLFAYGVANRLLIPLGLHHILNTLVWFQFGDYTVIENGAKIVKHGDLWRFFAGDKTAGGFMAGFFPVMMFGLLGAALAMVVTAKQAKRKVVAGILLSAALTSFLTGITEPLEFSFMFVAFPLYVIHAILMGSSHVIMNILGVKLGFTFSAGLFDYILSYGLGTKGYLLIPVGIVYFLLYFVIFYGAIKFFNFKTLGREEDDESTFTPHESTASTNNTNLSFNKATANTTTKSAFNNMGTTNTIPPQSQPNNASDSKGTLSSYPHKATHSEPAKAYNPKENMEATKPTLSQSESQKIMAYIQALGGAENIISLDSCTTRLRLEVKDNALVNERALKALGAKGVLNKVAGSVQVVIGPEVELLEGKIKAELETTSKE